MNLKKTIASIIILSILTSGCSRVNTKVENKIADNHTKQKTITKVQNDVNEIMDKDYDYVLKNMGAPYCTTYYIDVEIMESVDTVDELDKIVRSSNMRLIYPKYTSENQLDGSAIYIEINDNKVIDVQTYEFEDYDIETEAVSNNIDIILDQYNEKSILELSEFENIDFNNYINKNKENLYSIVGENLANFEAYDKNRERKIKGYFLKEDGNNLKKVLNIYENEGIIKAVDIVDANKTMDLLKSYLYDSK